MGTQCHIVLTHTRHLYQHLPAPDAKITHSTSRLVCVDTICVPIHNILTVVSEVTPVVSAGPTISEMPLPGFIYRVSTENSWK